MSDETDPVRRALAHSRDLYDIATWENRTLVDQVSVLLARLFRTTSRALVIGLAVAIIASQLLVLEFAFLRDPTLALLTLLSVLPALGLAGYIWYVDPTLRQSLRSLIITFCLGIVLAGFAAVINGIFDGPLGAVPLIGPALFFFIIVAPIEEMVKLLAVRFHAYRRTEFTAVVDGAIYGAVAGLGFATIENVLYITQTYLLATGSSTPVLPATIEIASVRSLVGPGHVIYSAFAGYYLGLAKFNREHALPIIIKGLLIAVFLHGSYNTILTYAPAFVTPTPLLFLVFILLFDGLAFFVLYRKLRRYQQVYQESSAEGDRIASEEATE